MFYLLMARWLKYNRHRAYVGKPECVCYSAVFTAQQNHPAAIGADRSVIFILPS